MASFTLFPDTLFLCLLCLSLTLVWTLNSTQSTSNAFFLFLECDFEFGPFLMINSKCSKLYNEYWNFSVRPIEPEIYCVKVWVWNCENVYKSLRVLYIQALLYPWSCATARSPCHPSTQPRPCPAPYRVFWARIHSRSVHQKLFYNATDEKRIHWQLQLWPCQSHIPSPQVVESLTWDLLNWLKLEAVLCNKSFAGPRVTTRALS